MMGKSNGRYNASVSRSGNGSLEGHLAAINVLK